MFLDIPYPKSISNLNVHQLVSREANRIPANRPFLGNKKERSTDIRCGMGKP